MYDIKKMKFTSYSYEQWFLYLKENDHCRLVSDFSKEAPLSSEMRKWISPSISAFQRGECSEGTHLLQLAEFFAKQYNEPLYTEVMRYFIKEENFHSAYLKKYMSFHKIPTRKKTILDSVFRRLRHMGGLCLEISTLVTAEIIALSYYTVLAQVSDSLVLKRICQQMLHDELPHVILQSYTLGHFPQTRRLKRKRILLMQTASVAVWRNYRPLFRRAGWTYQQFCQENFGYLQQSIELSKSMNKKITQQIDPTESATPERKTRSL